MFAPSLSWQHDHFSIKTAQKEPFSYLLHAQAGSGPSYRRSRSAAATAAAAAAAGGGIAAGWRGRPAPSPRWCTAGRLPACSRPKQSTRVKKHTETPVSFRARVLLSCLLARISRTATRAAPPHGAVLRTDPVAAATVPSPAKNGIFEPFIYIIDHFAKTGSGQT